MTKQSDNKNEQLVHSLQDILNMLMEECDTDDANLSRQTGIPASTISRMRINQNSNPTAGTLRPLAKFFDISISQLLGDESLPTDRIPGTHNPTQFTVSRVPIIDWEWVYKYRTGRSEAIKDNLRNWISTEKNISENAFALIVPTNSLGLAFRKGSLLIVDPNITPKDGDLALIKLGNDPNILFRQVLKDGNDIYIKSVNPEIKGTKLLEGNYEFIGTIIETRYAHMESIATDTQTERTTSRVIASTRHIQEA